jgi:thermitase
MKLTFLSALLFVGFNVFAEVPARFERTSAFIKIKDHATVPSSQYIKEVKHLFANNYQVKTTDVEKLIEDLNDHPAIVRIEKNYYAGKKTLPQIEKHKTNFPLYNFSAFNDPRAGRVWSFLDASENGVSVNKSYLAPLNTEKTEIIVAVVDTGVDYNHEDLKSVMWKNPGEIPGNGIDDDNNGYIDDVYGIDPLSKDSDPMASHAHGTHVAGTIAAAQNNNVGIAGIASNVKIMAIRTVPDSSDETDADVVESFLYAAKHGARLINCSFGKNHNEGGMIVNETMDYIGKTYGTLVFAAAGNDYGRDIDRKKTYPASFETDHMIVVASTAKGGGLSFFSNIGKKSVDIAAPGSNIYSTTPGNSYGDMSGTSMATPTAVGVAAEILSHFPELSGLALKEVLMKSAVKVKALQGKTVSEGRADLFQGLKYTLENFASLQQRQQQE